MEEENKTHKEVTSLTSEKYAEKVKNFLVQANSSDLKMYSKIPIEYVSNYTKLFIINAVSAVTPAYFEVQEYKDFSTKGRIGLPSAYECVRDFRIINYVGAKVDEVRLFVRRKDKLDEFVLIDTTKPKEDGTFSFGYDIWNPSHFSIQVVGEDKIQFLSLAYKALLFFPAQHVNLSV